MKALVVSDNHRDVHSLKELLSIYDEEIDLWLHCGDSEFMATDSIWEKFRTVRGNMDFDSPMPLYRVETLGSEKILVVHGHKQRVGFSLEPLKELAIEKDAKIVFYGHTHIPKVDEIDGIFMINPGSIIEPRGTLRAGSYAIYEKKKNKRFIRFYDWNHNEVKELSTKLT